MARAPGYSLHPNHSGHTDDSCIFLSSFEDSYSRNNKSVSEKRLRCFPHCNTSGHRNQGFCGDDIIALYTTPLYISDNNIG